MAVIERCCIEAGSIRYSSPWFYDNFRILSPNLRALCAPAMDRFGQVWNLEGPMNRRPHFYLMLPLSVLFALRVLAQLVQAVYEVPFLPPFGAWQGSGLPYPVLLGSQVVILVLVVLALWQVRRGTINPRPWQYLGCFALGGIYFAVMAFRLVAGLTFLAENEWFASSIPALFHVILASLILILGHYLLIQGKGKGRKSG